MMMQMMRLFGFFASSAPKFPRILSGSQRSLGGPLAREIYVGRTHKKCKKRMAKQIRMQIVHKIVDS